MSPAPSCSADDIEHVEMGTPSVVRVLLQWKNTGCGCKCECLLAQGMDLIDQHFHGFSEHGDGGHYHQDITPEIADYEAYFVVAPRVLRIDAPEPATRLSHSQGRSRGKL